MILGTAIPDVDHDWVGMHYSYAGRVASGRGVCGFRWLASMPDSERCLDWGKYQIISCTIYARHSLLLGILHCPHSRRVSTQTDLLRRRLVCKKKKKKSMQIWCEMDCRDPRSLPIPGHGDTGYLRILIAVSFACLGRFGESNGVAMSWDVGGKQN